jgi:hypothetical protein
VGDLMETDEKDNFEHLSQVESVDDDTMDNDVNVNDAIILDQSDVSNLQDKIEDSNFGDMDEIRTTHVTWRSRNVKMRKDLFDNYKFTQQQTRHLPVHPNIETISTQWSLKQGLQYYPKETKEAVMLELMDLNQFYNHL